MPDVPPPSTGLGSNSNYFLNNNGTNLNNIATTISISTAITASAGFGFQLNAFSPDNETCIIQQYVIVVDTGGQMTCIVNNWRSVSTFIINNWVPLYKLPSGTLPGGYQCSIALQNDRAGNITAATYTVFLNSALDGYETSFNNQQHVNYIGTDGHVHELVYKDSWGHTDLTQSAGAPAAAPGSALDGYETSFNNQQHVNYIGTDGHVYELVYKDSWRHTDLTQAAGGPAAAPGSALDGYETSYNNQQHVNYIGIDGHVHELVFKGSWEHTDLTRAAGAPAPAPGSALDGYESSDQRQNNPPYNYQQHVNYIGTDGHVHELVFKDSWSHTDLTHAAGAPTAAPGSALDGYETSYNNQQHVNYIGTDGHVHELVYKDSWGHTDLTQAAGAPAVAPGSALDGYETSYNNQQHVNYIGTDGHVHELVYKDSWGHTDLTQAAGAPAAAPGSSLDGYQTSFDNQQHVNYIGTDGHVHELVFKDSWGDTNLANGAVLASVTQTLLEISSGISSADLSPIVAFELDIVGFDNGQSTTLSSGSGTITYTATNAMTVANEEPSYCEFVGGTAETANTAYGELPTGSSTAFVQTFGTSLATIKAFKRNPLIKSKPKSVSHPS